MIVYIPVLLLCLLSAPAFAESQTYTPNLPGAQEQGLQMERAQQQKRDAGSRKVVPQKVHLNLTTLRESDEKVGLRFSVPDVVNGCWDISPLEYEQSTMGPYYFDITIKHYTRKEGSCSGKNRSAGATIPITKKMLEEGKIKVLRLTVGNTTDRFNVSYKNGIVEILPQTQQVFSAAKALTYNFEKSNQKTGKMIALIIPTAPAHSDVRMAISDFAAIYSLTEAPQNATSSLARENGGSMIYYYYDAKKTMTPRLTNEYTAVGQASIPRLYDAPDGRGQQFVPAPVYAKLVE